MLNIFQMKMKISIIIPTNNEAENIGRLVKYLFHYGENYLQEVIVVDAFSKDDTVRIAQQAGAKVFFSEKKSRAAQMNIGSWFAQSTQGEILYFVHADVIPPKSFAADIIHAVKEGFAAGNFCSKFMSDIYALRINERFTHYDFLFTRGGGDQTLFITRKGYEYLNGFNENYVIMEDFDFVKRARKKFPFKIIHKEVLVSARKYSTNSYVRVSLANVIVYTLYRAGVSSEFLASLYPKLLRPYSLNKIQKKNNSPLKPELNYV